MGMWSRLGVKNEALRENVSIKLVLPDPMKKIQTVVIYL